MSSKKKNSKKRQEIGDDDMDVEKEYDSDELDEEEIDDELELPKTLRNISFEEKKELLQFKREHNEREWNEEIFTRESALERQIDYERLKKLTASTVAAPEVPSKGKQAKARGKKIESDSEEEEEQEESSGEELEEGEEDESDNLVVDDEESEDDDDLFDSDEEAEINRRPTKKAADEEDDEDLELDDDEETGRGKKKSRVLGKRKKKQSKSRRSSRLASKYHSSDEEEEGSDDEEEDEGDDDEDRVDFDDDRHDYNLKSIKDSHRRPRGEGAEREKQSAHEKRQFHTLDDLKVYLQKQLPNELPIKPNDNDPATYNDYCKIFLRRDDICRKVHEPYFDQYIIGCYVRYLIGIVDNTQIYRMCEITGIERRGKTYRLPPASTGNVVETNIRLQMNNAGESKEGQKLDKLSNHSLQDAEIEFHINGMRNHPERAEVTKRDIRLIRNRNSQLENYSYSHADISKMVANQVGVNKLFTTEYITAMLLLKKRLDEATSKGDKEAMDYLRKEIKKMEDITEKQREMFEQHAKKQVDINRRMRDSNVTRDMDAGMRKRHEEQEAIAKGILPNAISDPFIRRETRPKILWNTQKKLEANKEKEEKEKESKDSEKQKSSLGNNSSTKPHQMVKKLRGQEDDRWAMNVQLSLAEVRKRVKARLGVDPYEAMQVSKKEKYLRTVCAGLPPIGSEEREKLRGKNNTSLKDYILLLSGNQGNEAENAVTAE